MAAEPAAKPVFLGMTEDVGSDSSDSEEDMNLPQDDSDSSSDSDNEVGTVMMHPSMKMLQGVDVEAHAAGACLVVEHTDAMLV